MKQLALILSLLLPVSAFAQKPDILEVIELNGEVHAGMASGVAEQVEKINDNAKIKAVLIVLDTPGGSVTASSVIYEDLSRLKVPVTVWCQSLCASGGVYLAMSPAVKWIAVRQETIGGSVGVVMQMMRFHRLLEWAKVDPKTYRSGHLKDAGNPTRAAEEAEDKYLQGIVGSLAEKFYAIVAKSRGAKIKDWDQIKTARIFIGSEIVKVGLADSVSTKAEVIAKAKELSGSKIIFTREELKKMSSGAHGEASYQSPAHAPKFEHGLGDVPWLIEAAKEVMGGKSVKFSYRLPYSF
jgi:signal peptide peptidase SppA